MRRDRRWVLRGLGGVALAGAVACRPEPESPSSVPTDAPPEPTPPLPPPTLPTDLHQGTWEPGGMEDVAAFPYGLQVGDVTPNGAVLCVRTAVDITIQVIEVGEGTWRQVFEQAFSPSERAVRVEVDQLAPGLRYTWVAWADQTRRSLQGWFKTPPDMGLGILRFGAVSCLGGNEPWPLLSRAAEQDLDVFLMLGDTVYADWGAPDPIEQKWDEAMAQDGMIDLTSSTSLIATWDDHEVGNNWSIDATPEAEWRRALDAFREALPQREGQQGELWRSLRWGDTAEFFVLDCRGERVGSRYLSVEQQAWLLQALTDSTATFKIILNSVPITDLSFIPIAGVIGQEDRWQGYPAQRRALVDHCAGIPGVFFITGDFHVGGAAWIDAANQSGAEIMEILAGPGGSPISSVYQFVPQGGRLPRLITEHNYTLFECDPETGIVDVSWIRNDGTEIERITLQTS